MTNFNILDLFSKENITDVIDLQKQLNDNTNTPCWVYGVTGTDNAINWLRCSHMEIAELIDSYPWKHWKDLAADPDTQNAKVELTDVLHFLASQSIHSVYLSRLMLIEADLIKEATDVYDDVLYPEKTFNEERFDSLLNKHKYANLLKRVYDKNISIDVALYNEFYDSIKSDIVAKFTDAVKKNFEFSSDFKTIIEKFEGISEYAITGCRVERKDEITLEVAVEKEMYLDRILERFVSVIRTDIPFNIIGLYFGKNVLNQFRQDNGYKDGTYIKMWNGKEDNLYMLEIVDELGKDANANNIYEKLDKIYKEL